MSSNKKVLCKSIIKNLLFIFFTLIITTFIAVFTPGSGLTTPISHVYAINIQASPGPTASPVPTDPLSAEITPAPENSPAPEESTAPAISPAPDNSPAPAESPAPSDSPEPTASPEPVVSPSPQVSPLPSATPLPTIKKADESNYIGKLKELGFYEKDSKTEEINIRNAILRFQSSINFVVDGKWTENCTAALNKRLEDTDFNYTDTVEKAPTTKKWITINKSTRILTLYEGSKVIKKYPLAIGNPPSKTPNGKFTIVSKAKNPAWGGGGYAKPVSGGSPYNPLGYRWMGLSYKGGNRYGIHGNNKPYSIGTNASMGCIRMINSDVESLYELVPKSTQVWIGTEAMLKKWGVLQSKY